VDRVRVVATREAGEQPAHLGSLPEVTAADAGGADRRAQVGEAVGGGGFVDPVQARTAARREPRGDRFVGEQHQLLDQAVRRVAVRTLDALDPAVLADDELRLGEFDRKRPLGEPARAAQLGEAAGVLDRRADVGVERAGRARIRLRPARGFPCATVRCSPRCVLRRVA
jgi:hypothetical protein